MGALDLSVFDLERRQVLKLRDLDCDNRCDFTADDTDVLDRKRKTPPPPGTPSGNPSKNTKQTREDPFAGAVQTTQPPKDPTQTPEKPNPNPETTPSKPSPASRHIRSRNLTVLRRLAALSVPCLPSRP